MSASATAAAWVDVYEIADELDQLTPGSGADFLDRFQATMTVLEQFPRLYGTVRRAPRGREVRCARIGRAMYLAVYEVRGDHASVFAVVHGRRQDPWRARL
jgi:hypothetical protein